MCFESNTTPPYSCISVVSHSVKKKKNCQCGLHFLWILLLDIELVHDSTICIYNECIRVNVQNILNVL